MAANIDVLRDIDAWALEEAAGQLVTWTDTLPEAARWSISVNSCAANFDDPDYPDEVGAIIERSGLRPERVVIELSEEAVLASTNTGIEVMAGLRELGVQVAIDNFGTDYSSFAQISELEFDLFKIDRSFLQDLRNSERSEIVRAVIQMARALGLRVVAEGVESADDLELLGELGSDLAQGYAIARPMPADAVEALASVASATRSG